MPYIIIEEVADFAEVFSHAGSAARAILLHLLNEVQLFSGNCYIQKVLKIQLWLLTEKLTSCSLLQKEQITCETQKLEQFQSNMMSKSQKRHFNETEVTTKIAKENNY
jgi:hypothetical protein